MTKNNKWEEMGDIFTKEGLAKLKTGQVLVFDYKGTKVEYKIMRINRKSHKCYVIKTKLYTQEEFNKVLELRNNDKK